MNIKTNVSDVRVVEIGASQEPYVIIQKALDYCYTNKGTVVIAKPGDYVLTDKIKIGDNTTLQMEKGVKLIRGGALTSAGEVHATIQGKVTTGMSNIKIIGGEITAQSSSKIGKHVYLRGVTNFEMNGTAFTGVYGDWNTAFKDCNNTRVSNVYVNSGTTNSEDGLHWYGGSNHTVTNCNITSGDDCIAFSNEGFGDISPEAYSLNYITVSNCTLHSAVAHAVRVRLVSGAPAITHVNVSNITGSIGGATNAGGGIAITGVSGNKINYVELSNISLDCSQNSSVGCNITYCDYLTADTVRILSSYGRALVVDSCDYVSIDKFFNNAVRNSNTQNALISENGNCNYLSITNSFFGGATTNGVVIGSTGAVADWKFQNNVIKGATNRGLRVQKASNGLVTGNYITGCTSYGIEEIDPSNNNTFTMNKLVGNGFSNTIVKAGSTSTTTGNFT